MQSSSIRCALSAALFFLASVHLALAQSQPTPPPNPSPTAPPLPTPDLSPARNLNSDEVIPVVIHYGEGQETRATVHRGVMAPVGLLQNQIVTVTLLLPTRAGEPVILGLYDGGQIGAAVLPGSENISLSNLAVPDTGTVRFNFQAGRLLGLYRLLVTIGPGQYLLQFYAGRPRDGSLPIPTPTPPGPPVTPTPN